MVLGSPGLAEYLGNTLLHGFAQAGFSWLTRPSCPAIEELKSFRCPPQPEVNFTAVLELCPAPSSCEYPLWVLISVLVAIITFVVGFLCGQWSRGPARPARRRPSLSGAKGIVEEW